KQRQVGRGLGQFDRGWGVDVHVQLEGILVRKPILVFEVQYTGAGRPGRKTHGEACAVRFDLGRHAFPGGLSAEQIAQAEKGASSSELANERCCAVRWDRWAQL